MKTSTFLLILSAYIPNTSSTVQPLKKVKTMAIQLDTNKALTNDEQIQFIIQLKFDLSFIELNDSIDNEVLYETALFKTSIVDKGTLTYT